MTRGTWLVAVSTPALSTENTWMNPAGAPLAATYRCDPFGWIAMQLAPVAKLMVVVGPLVSAPVAALIDILATLPWLPMAKMNAPFGLITRS